MCSPGGDVMPTVKDLSKLLAGIPKGSWVALSNDEERVIATAATLEQVLAEANKAGENRPVVIRVPETNTAVFLPTL